MTGSEALTEFERKLLPVRGIAGANAAWDTYRAETLPAGLDPTRETALRQGFDAGYASAMAATRRALTEAQNSALAGTR